MNTNQLVIRSIKAQAESILAMSEMDENPYQRAIDLIISSKGKLIFTGMGKSGIIAQKLAATYSSTGIPSFFVHPGEAYHGDLGMIEEFDVLFAFSNSGETSELINMLKYSRARSIIGISKSHQSTLARYSSVHLECRVDKEICPLNLAPTTSTTAALVMGDALCTAIMEITDFQEADFARFHPGGALGRSLLTKAKDLKVNEVPFVKNDTTIHDVLLKISEGRIGLACVGDINNVEGVITDGDVRRAFTEHTSFHTLKAADIASCNPVFVDENTGLSELNRIFREKKILSLLVGSKENLSGVVQFYDIHNG